SPHWQVSVAEMRQRAGELSGLLQTLMARPDDYFFGRALAQVESQIFDAILDMIPSAEVIEPPHSRARIARAVLQLLNDRRDDPPSITEMCALTGARERTMFLACVEAFGRSPAQLSLELRLNAAHRALVHPSNGASVT